MTEPLKYKLPQTKHINHRATTNAERISKYRRIRGGRQINLTATPEVAAGMIYLRNQWGMATDKEVVLASIRFLVLMTRFGLTKLPQTIDD